VFTRPQPRRADSPSSHRAFLTGKAIDKCSANPLLDGIEKQSSARKPRNSFSIHSLAQRRHSHVTHFAPVAEFNRAFYSLAGGSQGSIGDAEQQALLAAGPNPSFHTTREKTHFLCLERYSSHCGTLQAHLNEAGPQHYAENMLILHLHVRFPDRRNHIHRYSHS